MYILIVEDDPSQYEFIKTSVKEAKEFSNAEVRRIATELTFIENFEEIATEKPDIVIMDIMLRWTDPSPSMVLPPKEIEEKGFYRAGIRCIRMLKADDRTKHIPVIIYSVLTKEDLETEIGRFPEVRYLFKDFDAKRIITAIHSLKRA